MTIEERYLSNKETDTNKQKGGVRLLCGGETGASAISGTSQTGTYIIPHYTSPGHC